MVESIEDVIVEKLDEAEAFAEVNMDDARRARRRMRGMRTKRDAGKTDFKFPILFH